MQIPSRSWDHAIHAVEVMGRVMKTFDVAGISTLTTPTKDIAVLDLAVSSATLEYDASVGRMRYCALIQSRLREHVWIETDTAS